MVNAIANLQANSRLLDAIAAAIPWAMIHNAAEMAANDQAWQWREDYDLFTTLPNRGWQVSDTHASVKMVNGTITARSSGGHVVTITISHEGEVFNVNAGVDESERSFGHSLPPVERAKHIVQILKDKGIAVAKNATAEVESDWKQKQEVNRFLTKQGPERPDTRVRKALERFSRRFVVSEAKSLWPLSFSHLV